MALGPEIHAVVWDIGGVLLDWDPRHLYRKLFVTDEEVERFLTEVCTLEWHAAHDRGVGYAENGAGLIARHPEHANAIRAWSERSEEMERGEISGSVELLAELRKTGLPCYALTNMERDTYPRRLRRYPFMSWFDGIVVSSQEGLVKPDAELFKRLLERFGLCPQSTLMIDDSEANLRTAGSLGLQTIHFRAPAGLRAALAELGLL